MTVTFPPSNFRTAKIVIHRVETGQRFYRLYSNNYPDPLGVGFGNSRFSDPRPLGSRVFKTLYLGESFQVCFAEVILRDQRDGKLDNLPIAEKEMSAHFFSTIAATEPLMMLDLRNANSAKMGVPTDVAKRLDQGLARTWAVAFHEHQNQLDGIIYSSRLTAENNLAIFDRSIHKLKVLSTVPILTVGDLARVLDDFEIALV